MHWYTFLPLPPVRNVIIDGVVHTSGCGRIAGWSTRILPVLYSTIAPLLVPQLWRFSAELPLLMLRRDLTGLAIQNMTPGCSYLSSFEIFPRLLLSEGHRDDQPSGQVDSQHAGVRRVGISTAQSPSAGSSCFKSRVLHTS